MRPVPCYTCEKGPATVCHTCHARAKAHTLDEYQKQAAFFARYPDRLTPRGYIYVALGINGEAGEIAEKAKKAMRDNGGAVSSDRAHAMAMEVGDVLWYVAMVAEELGYTMSEIAALNIAKLSDRHVRNALKGDGDTR